MNSVISTVGMRDFSVSEPNVEITSVDITSYGGYVVAGCSNGVVLLFDMDASPKYVYCQSFNLYHCV